MRRSWGIVSLAVLALAGVALPVRAADTLPPSAWPNTTATQPRLDGWPHAIRVSGADRYQTGLAAALTLRGAGTATSYPFGSPDPATAAGWFGLATCPRSIIIVAGDNPADALAASSLSDPTGGSSEPYLQRTAAADPLFDPPGGFQKVDTDFAPILITRSARQGATALDLATRLAAQDLRSGGCTTARQAIIVGGNSAIPPAVENELVAIGYEQIFRVAGSSRYATAKSVAESLGTAVVPGNPAPTTCTDPLADDGSVRMTFYANSVVEFRASAQQCALLQRTVVLTDGTVGADALAAGWWTSYWQVPVLLHDGSGTLPAETASALQTLNVDNLVVLGGTGRISDTVAQQAAALASATLTRVSGADRYGTSVVMAQNFGGWYATGRGDEFAGSKICLAASSGGSAGNPGTGWADALSAGPWCARSAAATLNAPARALAPTAGPNPAISTAAGPLPRPAHDAMPVLLVPAGEATLPAAVSNLLDNAFQPADTWCTSVSNPAGCLAPGFAVVFGGPSGVTNAQVDEVSRRASGGAVAGIADRSPSLSSAFLTDLSMAPVFDDASQTGSNRICAARGAYSTARWLVTSAGSTTSADVRGLYGQDGDGVVRSKGTGAPVCIGVTAGSATSGSVRAVSMAGPTTTPGATTTFSLLSASRLTLGAALAASAPTSPTGPDSATDTSAGGTTTWTFSSLAPGTSVVSKGVSTTVSQASVTISLVRGTNTATQTGPDTFSATFSLVTALGTITGTAQGEAVYVAGGPNAAWKFRGEAAVTGGSWNVTSGRGGFAADIAVGGAGLADDAVSWRLDGVVA